MFAYCLLFFWSVCITEVKKKKIQEVQILHGFFIVRHALIAYRFLKSDKPMFV